MLWPRPTTKAPIRPLAQEGALKKKRKKKKKKEIEEKEREQKQKVAEKANHKNVYTS